MKRHPPGPGMLAFFAAMAAQSGLRPDVFAADAPEIPEDVKPWLSALSGTRRDIWVRRAARGLSESELAFIRAEQSSEDNSA